MHVEMVLGLASGIALAAACGLRAFLPLLAIGLAARIGFLRPNPGLEWIATAPALWALGTATVLELAADKVPWLDHALDVLGTVVRPVAGWIAAYAVLGGWPAPWPPLLALLLGTGALAVHGAKAHARLGSTAMTLGFANPLLSIAEDAATTVLVVGAIVVPLLAVALGALLVVVVTRRRRRTRLVA